MNEFKVKIQSDSGIPKFQQLIDLVVDAVSTGLLSPGDILPSVNHIFNDTGLARGTIVKALDELKRRGIVESVPNKGFFVARENPRVLFLLDTLRPFKQVIYDGIRENLPENVELNMYFHHYNIQLMEEILLGAAGRYSAFIIMGFEHPEIPNILAKLDPNKVMIFDYLNPSWGDYSSVVQEFENSLYDNLKSAIISLRKYQSLIFVCPDSANHPPEAKSAFKAFCKDFELQGVIQDEPGNSIKNNAFLVVDDKHLIELVKRTRESGLKTGSDVGIISFNDYPMKEVLEGGISVISPDFQEMAKQIAYGINKRKKIRSLVPPRVILRNSL